MSADADHHTKLALDESRLLILGAQVLFGFQLEGVFPSMFSGVPADSRAAGHRHRQRHGWFAWPAWLRVRS